ncbi:MAG: hypothetical protein ACO20H_06725 [Bacteriovoracaceae bacterium]
MSKEKVIIFLQLSDRVTEDYIRLSVTLLNSGIKLVPMKFDDIMALPKYKRLVIVALINDFNSFDQFKKLQKRYFEFAVLNKKARLIHLSSFSPIKYLLKEIKAKNYLFLKLPIDFDILGKEITKFYETKAKEISFWPIDLEIHNGI